MALIEGYKYLDKDKLGFDPETCPIEELEKQIEKYKGEEDYWNTMQLSAKTFINSVYGVFGTKYFNLANTDIAESITLQGQHLIKYSVVQINKYFKEQWHLDVEGHKRIASYMKDKFPDFDVEAFLKMASTNKLNFDTLQVYGDSVTGDTVITSSNGELKIKDMFDSVCDSDSPDKIRVNYNGYVFCADKSGNLHFRPIDYIMRHKTNKRIYRVFVNDKSVDVTEDHSIMIRGKDGILHEKSPKDCKIGDTVCLFFESENGIGVNDGFIKDIKILCESFDDYVYDISVRCLEDEDCHNFFANGILVHNTDSVSHDTVVRTKKHKSGIRISDFYDENSNNLSETTKAGHESVKTNDMVLNATECKADYFPVKRIIRHKVKKKKWKIVTASGKSIICTEDHSIIVFRDGKRLAISPKEIIPGDKIIECL